MKMMVCESLPEPVTGLLFSPDGRRLLVRHAGAACLLDAATGRQLAALGRQRKNVSVLAASVTLGRIVAGFEDASLALYDGGGNLLRHIKGAHEGRVGLACFLPNGSRFLTGCENERTVIVRDAMSGEPLVRLPPQETRLTCAIVSSDGSLVMTAADDGTIFIHAAGDGQVVARLWQPDKVYAAGFHPSLPLCFTAAQDGSTILWNFQEEKELAVLFEDVESERSGFSADGRFSRDTRRRWKRGPASGTARPVGCCGALRTGSQPSVISRSPRPVRCWPLSAAMVPSHCTTRPTPGLSACCLRAAKRPAVTIGICFSAGPPTDPCWRRAVMTAQSGSGPAATGARWHSLRAGCRRQDSLLPLTEEVFLLVICPARCCAIGLMNSTRDASQLCVKHAILLGIMGETA